LKELEPQDTLPSKRIQVSSVSLIVIGMLAALVIVIALPAFEHWVGSGDRSKQVIDSEDGGS